MATDKATVQARLTEIWSQLPESLQAKIRAASGNTFGIGMDLGAEVAAGLGIDEAAADKLLHMYADLATGAYDAPGSDLDTALGLVNKLAPAASGTKAGAAGAGDPVNNELQAFIDKMNGPLDPSDPMVQRLQNMGASVAERQASSAGIQGGMSVANSQQAALNASAPLQQQRQQLALQGMSVLSQRDIGLRQQALQELQMKNAAIQANFAAKQNQAAGMWSMVGGLASSIPAMAMANQTGGASYGLIGTGSKLAGGYGGSTVTPPVLSGTSGYGGYTPSGGNGY